MTSVMIGGTEIAIAAEVGDELGFIPFALELLRFIRGTGYQKYWVLSVFKVTVMSVSLELYLYRDSTVTRKRVAK